MAVYTINDLEKLSGIKAHTLRAWEQRYGILAPKRTDTNIRYYEDDDLKFLLNIALLNKNGIKISKIAKMSRRQIAEKVASVSAVNVEYGAQLDALAISMIEMDESKFDRIISANIQQMGFQHTMMEIIYPFLDKLSLLYLTGSVNSAQGRFFSYLIRQKLIAAIDQEQQVNHPDAKRFILYLPEDDDQELSMLFMHYILKTHRCKVVNLGLDISLTELKDACKIFKPDFIFTMITENFSIGPVQEYVDQLSHTFADSRILLSGYQVVAQKINTHPNVLILRSLDQTLQLLDRLERVAETP